MPFPHISDLHLYTKDIVLEQLDLDETETFGWLFTADPLLSCKENLRS